MTDDLDLRLGSSMASARPGCIQRAHSMSVSTGACDSASRTHTIQQQAAMLWEEFRSVYSTKP